MSVVQAAALCNVSRGCYYNWEAADYIHRKNLPTLARVLGLKERYLRQVNGDRDSNPVGENEVSAVA
jgi:hypothetical protein